MHITNIHPTATDHYELFVTADILGRPNRSSTTASKRKTAAVDGSARFQTERNRFTAAMRRARIEYLTFPKNRDLQLAFQDAESAETEFIRIHREDIRLEIKAGFRDDLVLMPSPLPSPIAQDPSGRTTQHGTATGFPFYRDCLIQLNEMVRKAATTFVNRPGRQTEKTYNQAVNARSVFEMRHEAAIRLEQAMVMDAESGSAKRKGADFGNRVYELGVRTERQHGIAVPAFSSHRGSGRAGEAGYASQSA